MRINSHSHVFTLRSILSHDSLEIVRRRLAEELSPPWLGKAAGGIAEDILEGLAAYNEDLLLVRLLARLEEEADFRATVAGADIPGWLRPVLVRSAETASLVLLRRAFAALLRALRPGGGGSDLSSKSLAKALDTLQLITRQSIGELAAGMFAEMPDGGGAVVLGLDLTTGGGGADPFDEQMSATGALGYRFPGRVFPFYGVDPRRPEAAARTRQALQAGGFVGVKIYPSTGWPVTDPRMADVFRYCADNGVPVLVHCNEGGFYGQKSDTEYANPTTWRPLLAALPSLKICFAHFGGASGLSSSSLVDGRPRLKPDHWANEILALADLYPGVYADLSAHSYPMLEPGNAERYFGSLRRLLSDPTYRERILFGTDFWLMRARGEEGLHWQFFEDHLDATDFRQIAEVNPWRYLGLPDDSGSGAKAAIRAYADRIAAAVDDPAIVLEELPAPWLLRLIEKLKGPARRAQVEAAAVLSGPAPSLRVPGWRQVLDLVAAEGLAEKRSIRLAGSDASKPLRIDFKGGSIGFDGEAALSLERFWDVDHVRDEDGVLVASAAADADQERPPHLVFDAKWQWLKYRLSGKLRLEGQASLASVGLHVDASRESVLANYRRHSRTLGAVDALRADLSRPRFALRRRDVLALGVGEALSLAHRGRLAVEATVTWGEALSANLGPLAQALEMQGPLAITASIGLTVTAGITVSDDFRVVFSRPDQGGDRPYRVSVFKLDSTGVDFSVALATSLQWSDPAALDAALDDLFANKLGPTLTKAKGLLDKADSLSATEQAVLTEILERLGVPTVEEAKEKLAALEKRVEETIEAIAKARLTAGFTFEYHRLQTSQMILDARLSSASVEELHALVVDGEIGGVLDRAGTAEVEIQRYLVERRDEVRRSWGFNLGSRVVGRDSDERNFVVQECNSDDRRLRKVSFQGARAYDGAWPFGDAPWHWRVDLRAEMKKFAEAPTTSDMQFGVALLFEWGDRKKKLPKQVVASALDMASLWGVLPAESQVRSIVDENRASLRLQLVISDSALARIVPRLALGDTRAFGFALGAAMPWRRDDIRSSAAQRRAVYGPVWERILQDIGELGHSWALDQRRELYRNWAAKACAGSPAVAAQERSNDNGSPTTPLTVVGRLELDGQGLIYRRWRDFLVGAGNLVIALREEMPGQKSESVRGGIYDLMQPLWKQAHWVRAFGALLLDAASAEGVAGQLGASFTVNYLDGADEKARVFGGYS